MEPPLAARPQDHLLNKNTESDLPRQHFPKPAPKRACPFISGSFPSTRTLGTFQSPGLVLSCLTAGTHGSPPSSGKLIGHRLSTFSKSVPLNWKMVQRGNDVRWSLSLGKAGLTKGNASFAAELLRASTVLICIGKRADVAYGCLLKRGLSSKYPAVSYGKQRHVWLEFFLTALVCYHGFLRSFTTFTCHPILSLLFCFLLVWCLSPSLGRQLEEGGETFLGASAHTPC